MPRLGYSSSALVIVSTLFGALTGVNAGEPASRNGNWLEVRLLGTLGLVEKGMVSREANGAIVYVTPVDGKKESKSVVAEDKASTSSYSMLEFTLGEAKKADVEILWPSGVKNKAYNVKRKRSLLFPEIPCSYEQKWDSFELYRECVERSLDQLKDQEIIGMLDKMRLYLGAKRAYLDHWDNNEN